MTDRQEDFAKGLVSGYQTALQTIWQELQTMDPRVQTRLMDACRARLEFKFDALLPSSGISDEYLHGLCAVQGALGLLPECSVLPEIEDF